MTFHDHFSGHADRYARHRPTYPKELFDWLASLTTAHDLAWDCATGNGQAAVELARHYSSVVATDASPQQIAHAPTCPRVEYRVEPAERGSARSSTVDLITVAQALHWLDLKLFYEETRRALKPGGVLAAWGYGLAQITPAVDDVVREYYQHVGDFWPPERRLVEQAYQPIEFPWPEIQAPQFAMEADWLFEDHVAYLRTWSATQRAQRDLGRDPLQQRLPELRRAWGDEQTRRRVRWPMFFRVGRRPNS